ncbi:unnamed protein product, partial [Chrysoparadoxa australica]
DETATPRICCCAYDLETTGLDPELNTVNQVCLVFWDTDKPVAEVDERTVVICTQDTGDITNGRVVVVPDERGLLQEMTRVIKKEDPEVLTGFNLTFDNKFLMKRAKILGCEALRKTSRCPLSMPPLKALPLQFLSSAALGNNERVLWKVPGRTVVDLYMVTRTLFPSLPSNKLDYVGERFVQEKKHDVPFGLILKAFSPESGTAELRGEIASYCVQDGRLCLLLMQTWSTHTAMYQEANVAAVVPWRVFDCGRQVKTISLLLDKMLGKWVFNTPDKPFEEEKKEEEEEEEGYQGATVIETIPGFRCKEGEEVAITDFSSLYPSLMRAHGISPELLIQDSQQEELAVSEGWAVERYPISAESTVSLARSREKALLPIILEDLLNERKRVRRKMKDLQDPGALAVLDALQKAIKVSCNSVYGILGARTGMLPLPELAATVTYTARKTLEFTQEVAESPEYGCKVIAGDTDSIMFTLPRDPEEERKAGSRMKYVWKRSTEIAEDVTARLNFPGVMNLELENVMFPSLFLKKKKWDRPEEPSGMKLRGISAVRNDRGVLNKRLSKEVLRLTICEGKVDEAMEVILDATRKLKRGKLDVEDYVISKSLKNYSPKAKSPHVELAKRIRRADPNKAPLLGEKVRFAVASGSGDLSDRAVLPEECEKPDAAYYFERQVLSLVDIMGPVMGGNSEAFRDRVTRE